MRLEEQPTQPQQQVDDSSIEVEQEDGAVGSSTEDETDLEWITPEDGGSDEEPVLEPIDEVAALDLSSPLHLLAEIRSLDIRSEAAKRARSYTPETSMSSEGSTPRQAGEKKKRGGKDKGKKNKKQKKK